MKKKILLIEDDPTISETTSEFLREEGFEVSTSVNGVDGIQKAIEIIPDLIISDISMPLKNGYEVCKTLQSYPDTSSIPFIFLSAKIQKEDLRLGMQLGADDYLTKPFDYSELLKSIRIRLEKIERYLKQGDEKFYALIDNPVVGVYIYANNKFEYSNLKLTEFVGYDSNEMKKMSFEDLACNDESNDNLEKIHKCIRGMHDTVHTELIISKKNQSSAIIELSGIMVKLKGKECLIGNIIEKNSGIMAELLLGKSISKSILSDREKEVLYLICKGFSSSEMAEKIFLSQRTIDAHRANLISKTDSRNTADLVMYAIRNKLVEL